ncbi:MAG: deoxyuridine 5'-triphosphate nucleotidohydrolase [Staphylothermus sp.]|nr:deoxyuridine 5'-triphosphate nucleotidohydrolase [Staphylothermus sp.]
MIIRPEDLIQILKLSEEQIDCTGVKLTLHSIYTLEGRGELSIDTRKIPKYRELVCTTKCLVPMGAYIVRYNEYVRIPNGYVGLAIPRSSLLRMGVTIHSAVWDPGYEGQGIGLMVVFNPHGVTLSKGVQVAQLVYFKMSGETQKIYRGVYKGERVY